MSSAGGACSGTPTTDYFEPMCGIPVSKYFWLDGLHPTYPIQDVFIEETVKLLRSELDVW